MTKLINFTTADGLKLFGALYEPTVSTKKIIIHVHGLSGNFYENKFLENLSKKYNDLGYAFLVFNNRGTGIISEFNDRLLGSAYENFSDSKLDIEASLIYVKSLGFTDIILEGHSFGCNKVIFGDFAVTGIILLAPTDVVGILKTFPNYSEGITKCESLVSTNQGKFLVEGFNQFFSAQTVLNNFIENADSDIFRYRDADFISSILTKISVPVLVVIGELDSLVFTKERNIVQNFFNKNISNLSVSFIEGANHSYLNKEDELSNICSEFVKSYFGVSK